MWTVGLAAEIKLRFQIPPAWCGRGLKQRARNVTPNKTKHELFNSFYSASQRDLLNINKTGSEQCAFLGRFRLVSNLVAGHLV